MERVENMKIGMAVTAMLLALTVAAPARARSAGSQDEKAIAEAMSRYTAALEAGPSGVATLAGSFAPDGELLEPGMESLRGPEAVRKFLEPLAAAVTVRDAAMTSETIEVHGDTAYQWGHYSQKAEMKGQPAALYQGRFVTEWVRLKGAWKIRRLLVQPTPQSGGAS